MPYLLKARPFDESLGAVRPLYFSDVGFTTEPGEVPANTYFVRRIETPLRMKRSLYDGGAIGGFSTLAAGSVTLANDDGQLDWLEELAWDGREVEILYSPLSRPRLADFARLQAGTAEQLVPGDLQEIVLRDLDILLDRPASRGRFAGTGGIEGTLDLTGRERPFLLGRRRQIEPVLIDPAHDIWMIDPAGFGALLAARDQGVAIGDRSGDYGSYAALVGATVGATAVATARAAGLVRTGRKPHGRFTVDAEGVAPAGVWIGRFADLTAYVVSGMADAPLASGDLDGASFAAMAARCPQVLGYWYDGGGAAPTVRAVVDALADSVGAWWGFGLDRRLQLGRYDGPASTPDFVFDARHIVELTPRRVERRLKRSRVGYRPYAAVFRADELDNATTDGDRVDFAEPYRWREHTDPAVAAASLLAREEDVEALFDDADDALAEAVRRVAVHGPRRKSFDATVPLTPGLDVGATVRLIDSRFRLTEGRNFVVLTAERDADAEQHLLTLLG